jgi:16S rRNA (guanine1207-N2)-methyltransferase
MLQSCLLCETVPLASGQHLLVLNSAADPFVAMAAAYFSQNAGALILAEDNLAQLQVAQTSLTHSNGKGRLQDTAFHFYILHHSAQTIDSAILNLFFQPGNAWSQYALQIARYALKPGGALYIVGPKDRGIQSFGKRMQTTFGNMEVLEIKKGWRVLRSIQRSIKESQPSEDELQILTTLLPIFAAGRLDEGSQLLLESLEVHQNDRALDIGCGAGYLGFEVARRASEGHVTLVDVSLAAVDVARYNGQAAGLTNIEVLASDGAKAVLHQRFDLVVTNPPFHQGGLQTLEIAERFIREAAQVLRPQGRLYLVANRFLKYEPTLQQHFKQVQEVGGNSRFKVLLALKG